MYIFRSKKAFDTVDHDILLYELHNNGMRGIVHEWFKSYLSNRQHYTRVQHSSSNMEYVTCGVPHSSLLSPLLFLIYMNDNAKALPGKKNLAFC